MSNILDTQYNIPEFNTDYLAKRLTEGLKDAWEIPSLELTGSKIELPLIKLGQIEVTLPPYSSLL